MAARRRIPPLPKPSLLVALLFFGGTLFAQEGEPAALNSLRSVAALALENNLDLKKSLWELTKTRENLPSIWTWESSSITITGKTTADKNADSSGDAPWEGPWGGSAALTLPLLDQLRLEGTINHDTSGKAEVVVLPLAHSDEERQGMLSQISGEIAVEETRVQAENRALKAALGWMTASSELNLQTDRTELREAEYRDGKVRYEAGEGSLEEVRTALRDWSSARSQLGTARDALIRAETELSSALGTRNYSLSPLGIPAVRGELEELRDELSDTAVSAGAAPAVRQDQLRLKSLEEELKDTWIFNPSLQGNFSFSWDQDGKWTLGGGLSLGFSLKDFQGQARKELAGDRDIVRAEAEENLRQAELALAQVLEGLEIARLNREVAELSLEEAEILEAEAAFLHGRGELSLLEWKEAQLEEEDAKSALFKALAEEYTAWLELKIYL